jgi:hypothetical protein
MEHFNMAKQGAKDQTQENNTPPASTEAPSEVKRGSPTVPDGRVKSAVAQLVAAGFKVAKQVTLPSLTLKVDEPRVLVILEAMKISDFHEPGKEAATICAVGDVMSGEQATLLVPTTVKSNLERQYPADDNGKPGYVGKTFLITRMMQRAGKKYHDHTIVELEETPELIEARKTGNLQLPDLSARKPVSIDV